MTHEVAHIVALTDFGGWLELQRDATAAKMKNKNSDGRPNSYQNQKPLLLEYVPRNKSS